MGHVVSRDYGERGTGRTTRQMLAAPFGALFVWANERVDYPKFLSCALERSDLIIKSPRALEGGRLAGIDYPGVVIDHAALLTPEQRAGMNHVIERIKSRKSK